MDKPVMIVIKMTFRMKMTPLAIMIALKMTVTLTMDKKTENLNS